jgi:glycosyltransferase involved in cell wall biosynthesis
MLKIVHLDTGTALRGGQQQLLTLARGLRQRAHQQLIVCPEASPLEAHALEERFNVFALPAHDIGLVHGIVQLRQWLAINPSQVLHAHDGRGQTVAWLASLGMPVSRVASRRVTFLPAGMVSRHLKYGRACHGIIAVSDFVRQLLVNSGVPAAKVETIPDGIEIPAELPSAERRSRIRAQWGFGEQEFLVGHVGAFTWEKGQDIAIEATTRLRDKLPHARLLLVGEGPLQESRGICDKVDRAQGHVRLLGYCQNLSEFFAGLDLFVMPSRSEGLGSSALMAMAHGIPVVATRVGGLPELVEDSKTGWLVRPESPSTLADAVVTAASDRARLRRFGLDARKRARQFSSAIMVERTESVYHRLLANQNKIADL